MYTINFENLYCNKCGKKMICKIKDINTMAKVECECKNCGSKDFHKSYELEIDAGGNIAIKPVD